MICAEKAAVSQNDSKVIEKCQGNGFHNPVLALHLFDGVENRKWLQYQRNSIAYQRNQPC